MSCRDRSMEAMRNYRFACTEVFGGFHHCRSIRSSRRAREGAINSCSFRSSPLLGRQFGQILPDMDAGLAETKQRNGFLAAFAAKNQASEEFFIRLLVMFSQPTEV